MPLGSPLTHCLCVVNDCDEPVAVLPNVENHVSLYVVGIFERAANFRKIVPSNLFDDNHACFDLVAASGYCCMAWCRCLRVTPQTAG